MSTIKTMVRSAYNLQQLRIQMGNRIVGNFKVKLGQEPGKPESDLGVEEQKIIDRLRQRYKKITDGVVTFPRQATFKGDEIISTFTELCLISGYVELEEQETKQFNRLKSVLNEYPIYTEFLEKVRGIGPAMAGVIVSEIDITKAKYASSLSAYAGLDVVSKWVLQGTAISRLNFAAKHPVLDIPTEMRGLGTTDEAGNEQCLIEGGEIIGRESNFADEPKIVPPQEGKVVHDDRIVCIVRFARDGFHIDATYRSFSFGGRSRRKEHLVERQYIDKDGNPATRVGISFNPFLKTKLTGVLGPSFLKSSNEKYAKCYYDYKARLENEDGWKDESKGHRHNAAIRFCIKIFLQDLYAEWRRLEGLPVHPPYREAKLGMLPHNASSPQNASASLEDRKPISQSEPMKVSNPTELSEPSNLGNPQRESVPSTGSKPKRKSASKATRKPITASVLQTPKDA